MTVGPIRVSPVPRREPPVISADEAFAPAAADTGYVQGALALVTAPRWPLDGAGGTLPRRRPAPTGGAPTGPRGAVTVGALPGDDEPDPLFDRQPTARADLPLPGPFAARIGQALVEVLWGARPAVQVVRWTSGEVQAVVARRSLVAARRGTRPGRPPVVRRVRVCEPADGIAEVSLVVVAGDRVRAVALRLTGLDGRWVVTELQVG